MGGLRFEVIGLVRGSAWTELGETLLGGWVISMVMRGDTELEPIQKRAVLRPGGGGGWIASVAPHLTSLLGMDRYT